MEGEVEERERSAGRRGEAGYGEGVERERGEGSSAERAREGGVLVEIEDRGTRASFEYSRRCYARGYTYIYGRWCMVCHDGSNSGIPGLKLTSQWGSVGKLPVPRLKGFVVAAPLLSRDTGPTFRRVNGRNMIIRETFAYLYKSARYVAALFHCYSIDERYI